MNGHGRLSGFDGGWDMLLQASRLANCSRSTRAPYSIRSDPFDALLGVSDPFLPVRGCASEHSPAQPVFARLSYFLG